MSALLLEKVAAEIGPDDLGLSSEHGSLACPAAIDGVAPAHTPADETIYSCTSHHCSRWCPTGADSSLVSFAKKTSNSKKNEQTPTSVRAGLRCGRPSSVAFATSSPQGESTACAARRGMGPCASLAPGSPRCGDATRCLAG